VVRERGFTEPMRGQLRSSWTSVDPKQRHSRQELLAMRLGAGTLRHVDGVQLPRPRPRTRVYRCVEYGRDRWWTDVRQSRKSACTRPGHVCTRRCSADRLSVSRLRAVRQGRLSVPISTLTSSSERIAADVKVRARESDVVPMLLTSSSLLNQMFRETVSVHIGVHRASGPHSFLYAILEDIRLRRLV